MTRRKAYWDEIASLLDGEKDRYECRICGRLFVFLGAHLKAHGLYEMEYKDQFGILHGLPLCVPSQSELRRNITTQKIDQGLLYTPEQAEKFRSSKRNEGRQQPIQAIQSLVKKKTGIPMSSEARAKMSEYAKKRANGHNEKISQGLIELNRPRYETFQCSYCGRENLVPPNQVRKKKGKTRFCDSRCYFAYIRLHGLSWANHTRAGKERIDGSQ